MSYNRSNRYNTSRSRSFPVFGCVFVAVVILVILGIVGAIITTVSSNNAHNTQTCKVDDKDRSSDSKGNSIYRIYSDCGVFAVDDNLFFGKFNSADTYNKIKVGSTYQFDTVGFRNGFLSMFPNILSATPVS